MKRKGTFKPTIEDVLEISGVEMLHPGGLELTKRTAELANLKHGMTILEVSSGRGTQSIFYAKNYGVKVVGVDISDEMIQYARKNVAEKELTSMINFVQADSQQLPFQDETFDAVINECAVGIPDDSQKVLSEMARVACKGAAVVMHESTWRKALSDSEKEELSERYGTTPLELSEWLNMMHNAGLQSLISEHDRWSKPEMFWNIREGRNVTNPNKILTINERIVVCGRLLSKYGYSGLLVAFVNESKFKGAVLDGKIGYSLFRGIK